MKLVEQLEDLGYNIYLEGDKIHYKFEGRGRLDPDASAPLLEELKRRKDEVIEHLKFMQSIDGFITEKTRKLFFCEGRKK